jgi:hypothetical protein
MAETSLDTDFPRARLAENFHVTMPVRTSDALAESYVAEVRRIILCESL